MSIPERLTRNLTVPVIAAPMFLVSNTEYVIKSCQAGIIGTFPILNGRTVDESDHWLQTITRTLTDNDASFGVNLVVRPTNERLAEDLELVIKYKVPLVITSMGANMDLINKIHDYGGLVFHDVTTIRHARKAASAGVDGLILVCNGAGGHAGVQNPFAFVPQVREFFDGTVVLGGAMSDGKSVAAAEILGADMTYMGTRFINVKENLADDSYKQMIVDCEASDVMYTPAISGLPASFLRPSLVDAGLDPATFPVSGKTELNDAQIPWKNLLSAGQGTGSIHDIPTIGELVGRLKQEYDDARHP
jgi:nitronate monooxygenase